MENINIYEEVTSFCFAFLSVLYVLSGILIYFIGKFRSFMKKTLLLILFSVKFNGG